MVEGKRVSMPPTKLHASTLRQRMAERLAPIHRPSCMQLFTSSFQLQHLTSPSPSRHMPAKQFNASAAQGPHSLGTTPWAEMGRTHPSQPGQQPPWSSCPLHTSHAPALAPRPSWGAGLGRRWTRSCSGSAEMRNAGLVRLPGRQRRPRPQPTRQVPAHPAAGCMD